MNPVRVIFRKWNDSGTTIAIFPDLPWSQGLLTSYEHVGQHGGCHYKSILKKTVLAIPREYVSLQNELEHIGYELRIVDRAVL